MSDRAEGRDRQAQSWMREVVLPAPMLPVGLGAATDGQQHEQRAEHVSAGHVLAVDVSATALYRW